MWIALGWRRGRCGTATGRGRAAADCIGLANEKTCALPICLVLIGLGVEGVGLFEGLVGGDLQEGLDARFGGFDDRKDRKSVV